ncbi:MULTISPECIES: SH3-like domain-containing protein [Virgibacillus]|uniref:SH3-like domain-containing protein n=1 Tax=Virgibacillus TaxID=84406 RepID=UPI001E43A51F|nr:MULTISPECIES: SH3-like domain-containing protein [Virgibacillus]MED3735324.1 SH3-like domain-containing protein [Virgibacillus pantothenticus]
MQPTSKIGHINDNKSFIYSSLFPESNAKSSETYKNSVYYIKREAKFNNRIFYLLSNKPSGKSGVIGWMNANDVNSKCEILIDADEKQFYIKGTGKAFNRPWGGKKNIIYDNLKNFKGDQFLVSKTVKIGKNLWYKGLLGENKVWIHQSYLGEV